MTTAAAPTVVELLWFEDCPNHRAAEAMIQTALAELGIEASLRRIEVPDVATGDRVRFPGSPTIRVNGHDIEPGFEDCADCTPRCRIYATEQGFRGVPERVWLIDALTQAA